jgi:hypothetical protein
VPGTFAYLPAAGTIESGRGTVQTLSTTFTPSDSVNYTTASKTATITVLNAPPVAVSKSVNAGTANARAITLNATDYENDPLTYTIVGPSHGTLTGTAPNMSYTSNAGYVGTDSFTFQASDGPWGGVSNTATVTINVMTPITTTTASTISALSVQYSDQDTFTASITPTSIGPDAPATMVNFKIGTEIVGTASLTLTGGVYSATWTGQMIEVAGQPTGQMKPGAKVMTAALADPTGLYTVGFPNKSLTMTKEDARVGYSGQSTLKVQADGTVTLLAWVKDITAVTGDPAWDNYAGDVRNAQVSFVDRSTNTILGTVNVSLAGTDPKIGTASYVWTPSLGTATSKTYTVGFIVTNYYNRNNTIDNATVTVTK